MLETRLDRWINDNFLIEHLVHCNTIPNHIPQRGIQTEEVPDITSKWSMTIICTSPDSFHQICALMVMQRIPYSSEIIKRKSLLGYLLKKRNGESLSWGIFWGLIHWILVTLLTILSPLYLIKIGLGETIRQLKNFIVLLSK